MSNSKKGDLSGTVFMGPLSYREEKVETIVNAQLSSKWNEETETTYMETVRNRAITKVRAMLLQAKRRSDEIIGQAEVNAKKNNDKAKIAHADLLEAQKKAQLEYDHASELATENANAKMQEQLAQDQKALGESTAVVLLSIHQQLQSIYDAWREELRLLTLEAIQVGTGWVADSNKEEILASMLNECVRKLIEKKDYTVRVHPSDGALVTQVLENSREKSWSMETDADLAPGSLEVENKHAMVKNSSQERRDLVQGILDNLALPSNEADSAAMQSVTNTLMDEMQKNPLLAQASADGQDDELNGDIQENPAQNFDQNLEPNLEQDDLTENTPEDIQNNPQADNLNNDLQNNLHAENEQAQDNTLGENENNDDNIANAKSKSDTQDIETQTQVNVDTEAESLVDEFLNDHEDELKLETLPSDSSPHNSDNSEISSNPGDSDTQQGHSKSLPPDVADDLLAEMGFDATNPNSN